MASEEENFKPKEITYEANFLDENIACNLFDTLIKDIEWEEKGNIRKTSLYGDAVRYSYGPGSGEISSPRPWLPELRNLRDTIYERTGHFFDVCLCGLYSDGKKYIGWHADREEIGKRTPICSISLGARRRFAFRMKEDKSKKYEMTLNNGSLLMMENVCQTIYTHRLLKDPEVKDARINLTFRNSTGFQPPTAELRVKDSLFRCFIVPQQERGDVVEFLKGPYSSHLGENAIIHVAWAESSGLSDRDGEPKKSKVAQRLLNELKSAELPSHAVIVWRHFGGTLLGSINVGIAYESVAKMGVSMFATLNKKKPS